LDPFVGSLGGRTVGYLAEKYFTDDTSRLVQQLLSNDRGHDISDAALFADKIRFRRPATAGWHFIGKFGLLASNLVRKIGHQLLDAQDHPPNSCGVNFGRDCNREDGDPGCIVSAIVNMVNKYIHMRIGPAAEFLGNAC
jgi:hypothetical protein